MWVLGSFRLPSSNVWLEALGLSDAQVGGPPYSHLVSASEPWPSFVLRRIFHVHLSLVSVAQVIMFMSAASRPGACPCHAASLLWM